MLTFNEIEKDVLKVLRSNKGKAHSVVEVARRLPNPQPANRVRFVLDRLVASGRVLTQIQYKTGLVQFVAPAKVDTLWHRSKSQNLSLHTHSKNERTAY